MGEKWPVNLACDSDFHVNHRVRLHAQICDMGQTALGEVKPKNQTASAGFEPAILGIVEFKPDGSR
jgi:hypothetical protein